jgi:hypothetical protein
VNGHDNSCGFSGASRFLPILPCAYGFSLVTAIYPAQKNMGTDSIFFAMMGGLKFESGLECPAEVLRGV